MNGGSWNAGDSKSSYEAYNLAHGKTPGGSGGGSGGGGDRIGCGAAVVFGIIFFGSIAALIGAGVSAAGAVFLALLLTALAGLGLIGLSRR
jgi:hypothetical protein